VSDFAVNPDVGLWERNAVLNGRNSFYVTPDHVGTLSIKTVLNGEGSWITPAGRYRLTPGSFLVLNEGQQYSVDIRARETVETFCVFFKPGFMEGVSEGLSRDWDGMLETDISPRSAGFYERLNPADDFVSPHLERLRRMVRGGQGSEIHADEILMQIAEGLLNNQGLAAKQRESLDLAKGATREEIYRRLNIARDFMIASLDKPADLKSIAETAALSPFHFHRLFKRAYRETPHEFLTKMRLAKARHLLKTTDLPMHEIAWAIGFESAAAFTKLFTRATGSSPTSFRRTG
jgi:AraC family transcriptional regulator